MTVHSAQFVVHSRNLPYPLLRKEGSNLLAPPSYEGGAGGGSGVTKPIKSYTLSAYVFFLEQSTASNRGALPNG